MDSQHLKKREFTIRKKMLETAVLRSIGIRPTVAVGPSAPLQALCRHLQLSFLRSPRLLRPCPWHAPPPPHNQ
ncbi:hypothetical protein AOLI_G00184590 [Acnodon oligacanthus]